MHPRHARVRPVRALHVCALLAALAPAARAQDGHLPVTVNSEGEAYLRVLQVAGKVPLYPWSVRGFSPAEVDRLAPADGAHPWAGRYAMAADSGGGTRVRAVDPEARLVYNSALPYGLNDGPTWAGKGATLTVRGGATLRRGPLSVTLAPEAWVAANKPFTLGFNGYFDQRRYADFISPRTIDLPQRFGAGTVTKVDLGQSAVRLDLGPLAIGAGTANQHWGPAVDHPLILGSNAAGFRHAYLGTSRPANVWVGHLHGRVVYGALRQSDQSLAHPDSTMRFMSGLAVVFVPRGVPGLEIGASRFFHTAWGDGPGGDEFAKPFSGLLKTSVGRDSATDDGSRPDNQLASVFVRWVAPRAGLEVWGEYGKEDHNRDFRQFFLEMDNGRGYALGFRRVWAAADGRTVTALRGEVMHTLKPNINLVLPQGRWYVHGGQRQGHTNEGQTLGSPAAPGGGASVVALDRYTPRGRMTLRWDRMLRAERHSVGAGDDRGIDVMHALGVEGVFFVGRANLSGGLRYVKELNRDFGGDASTVNASFGAVLSL